MDNTVCDYVFTPWKVQDGMRIVASESEWNKPAEWNEYARFITKLSTKRKLVVVNVDVFEDWQGLMAFEDGDTVFVRNGQWTANADSDDDRPLTMDDVRQRLFLLIDDTHNLDWLLL